MNGSLRENTVLGCCRRFWTASKVPVDDGVVLGWEDLVESDWHGELARYSKNNRNTGQTIRDWRISTRDNSPICRPVQEWSFYGEADKGGDEVQVIKILVKGIRVREWWESLMILWQPSCYQEYQEVLIRLKRPSSHLVVPRIVL